MLSAPGAIVRRHDPDSFLTALFAPAALRETLLVLYAFNHELARARAAVSQPTLALIRLQWWREVVEGAPRRHEVATPLAEGIRAGRLDRAELLALIAGREIEAEPAIPSFSAWRSYLLATAGGLAAAAGHLLGAPAASLDKLRALGAAYGMAGVLRSVPAHARQGRCLLPEDVLARHGLSPEAVIRAPSDPALHPVLRTLAAEGRAMLGTGRGAELPRPAVAAALPSVLARRDLGRIGRPVAARGLGDRLAVTLAGLTGRI